MGWTWAWHTFHWLEPVTWLHLAARVAVNVFQNIYQITGNWQCFCMWNVIDIWYIFVDFKKRGNLTLSSHHPGRFKSWSLFYCSRKLCFSAPPRRPLEEGWPKCDRPPPPGPHVRHWDMWRRRICGCYLPTSPFTWCPMGRSSRIERGKCAGIEMPEEQKFGHLFSKAARTWIPKGTEQKD